jgi:hypothetical protein
VFELHELLSAQLTFTVCMSAALTTDDITPNVITENINTNRKVFNLIIAYLTHNLLLKRRVVPQ